MSTKLKAGTASSGAVLDADTTGILEFQTGSTPTTAITVDASQNVGIGTNSPAVKLDVGYVGGSVALRVQRDSSNRLDFYQGGGVSYIDSSPASGQIAFATVGTERMRIDSSGNLLVAKTTADGSTQDGLFFQSTGPAFCTVNSTTFNTWHLYNRNATNNGYRFYVNVNGGVNNYSGNNVNLSDERTKTNIEVAGNYLNKICSIPVKLFNYRDEADGEQRTLGVIAQDVEAVAPEFVNVNGWEGEQPKDGIPLKSIYTTDIMFGLMKAIQELNAKVDAQAAEIAVLKGAK